MILSPCFVLAPEKCQVPQCEKMGSVSVYRDDNPDPDGGPLFTGCYPHAHEFEDGFLDSLKEKPDAPTGE